MMENEQEHISALELSNRAKPAPKSWQKRNHNENTFVRDPIIRYLRAIGVFCWPHSNTGIKVKNKFTGREHWVYSNMRGISDIIGWLGPRWGRYAGRFVAVECKYGDNTASPEQAEFLRSAKESHCVSILAYDIKDVQTVLDAIRQDIEKGE